MAAWNFSATDEANLMKIKYGQHQDKQFNEDTPLKRRIIIKDDFAGSEIKFPVTQSVGGGVSSGNLPTANISKTGSVTLSSKKLYAAIAVDRESMLAAMKDEGAFVRATADAVDKATRSFNRNLERMMTVGDATGTGALITGHASNSVVTGSGTACAPYVVTFNAASQYTDVDAEVFEENDLVNINSETTELEIVTIATTATSVVLSLVGTSSTLSTRASGCGAAFGATDKIYMEGSKDNEMIGIRGVIAASSSTLYGITVGRRWKSFQKNAAAALTVDLINEVVLGVKRQSGASPKMVLSSYKQYEKLLNLLEDKKRYPIPARRGEVSFEAVQVMTADGAIPVFVSRFIKPSEMFFLNDDYIRLHLRPGGIQWHADLDNSVFKRNPTADQYDARYGAYGQLFVNPHFQGYLYGLSV